MIKIEYPEYKPSIRTDNGKEWIFDPFRKKWIILTPEEWVRQNFLQYLVTVLRYPPSLIAIEKEILLGDVTKRFDIVVYNRESKPYILVECKEMNVLLSESVFHQVLRYNTHMQAGIIIITNGSYCIGFKKEGEKMEEIDGIPGFEIKDKE